MNKWMNEWGYKWTSVWITLFLWGKFTRLNKPYTSDLHHSPESDPIAHTKSCHPEYWASRYTNFLHFPIPLWVGKALALTSWVWRWKSTRMRCLFRELHCWLGRLGVQLSAFIVCLVSQLLGRPWTWSLPTQYVFLLLSFFLCKAQLSIRHLFRKLRYLFFPIVFYFQWNTNIYQSPRPINFKHPLILHPVCHSACSAHIQFLLICPFLYPAIIILRPPPHCCLLWVKNWV